MKLCLKKISNEVLLEVIPSERFPLYMKGATFDDLMPAIIKAFDILDFIREEEEASNKYYVLTLKKFWKKYGSLPDVMKIDDDEFEGFRYALLDATTAFLNEIFGDEIRGYLDRFKWDGRFLTNEEKLWRALTFPQINRKK